MSASDDGGVHEPQQPERTDAPEGKLARGCAGAVLGGLCGAVTSLVSFVIVVFVGYQFNPNFGWALVLIGGIPIAGTGVGAIFGAAFLAAKGSFGWGAIGGCLGGVLSLLIWLLPF